MPKLVEWDKCCGCGACATLCPKMAITMLPNGEGFLHPVVDGDLCVECKACERACPGLAPAKAEGNTPRAFIVQHKDDQIRYESTSGGAFTAIAEEIIKRGGVVFGAAMTDRMIVKHISVNTIDELARFRNSKYVQSEIGNCYKDAKERLKQGQLVCFSGTPCQINGLYKYLDKGYDNLITVDVVCKSVPSPLVFQKYMAFKMQKEGHISDIVFRDKKRGFQYCTLAHYASHSDKVLGNDIYRRGSESDEWLRLFLSGKIARRSCTTCPFQTLKRVSDFTLGDIWETGNKLFDDNRGSTLVHVWNCKSLDFLNSIKDSVRVVEYPVELSRGAERINTLNVFASRERLFFDAFDMAPSEFFRKYTPDSILIILKRWGRYFSWKFNIHNTIRHLKHLIIHRKSS